MDIDSKPNVTKQSKYCCCSKSHCSGARANVKSVIACRCAADPVICSHVKDDSDSI